MKKKFKIHILDIFFILVFIAGIVIMSIPYVSTTVSTNQQQNTIKEYNNILDDSAEDAIYKSFQQAVDYNEKLAKYRDINQQFYLQKTFDPDYSALLDISKMHIMGTLEIPVINVDLPIYHGTDENSLRVGVGHLEGSSLPVGGKSSHCVISGHTGLVSATLLTDLDEMDIGDIFYLHVLHQTLAYEVDQIKTVLPTDTSDLNIIDGKDLCTLITCTPYGINSHRLLVRGHRIAYVDLDDELKQEVNILRLPVMIAGSLVLYIIGSLIKLWREKRNETE